MEAIRIGLVGFGAWPRRAYAPLLKEFPAVRVVAVAARSEESRDLARETFGDDIAVTSDYRQLLEADDVDALMIALPNALHADALQAAIKKTRKTIQSRTLVPALKAIISHYHNDAEWGRLMPPMMALTAEEQSGLIADLDADEGFSIAPAALENAAE